jgi:hypothetical protein
MAGSFCATYDQPSWKSSECANCEVTAQLIALPDMLDRIVRFEAIDGKRRRRSYVPKTEKPPLLV